MITSLVVDPRCFAPEVLAEPEARIGAERLLHGVLENGILLCTERKHHVTALTSAVAALDSRAGQRLQVLMSEIGKNQKMFVAPERLDGSCDRTPTSLDRIGKLAVTMCSDLVVCRDRSDERHLSRLRRHGIEVCALSDYVSSDTEGRRRDWYRTTRVDNLPDRQSAELIGRLIRYATDILVIDRVFARAAATGGSGRQITSFAGGLVYLADCWREFSPYAGSCGLNIHLISIAGSSSAAAGHLEPGSVEAEIRRVVSQVDSANSVRNLVVRLKADRQPPIVKDRFVSVMGRCFGVQHGIDDIGRLAGSWDRRGPTSIIPDCQDYRDLVADIRTLKAA